jgi:histidinol-phosphate aminotransferase
LRAELAKSHAVWESNLLVTSGSSEAIAVVIRTFCRAYQDSVVSIQPTFELYPYSASIQGAESIEVPLLDETVAVDCARM